MGGQGSGRTKENFANKQNVKPTSSMKYFASLITNRMNGNSNEPIHADKVSENLIKAKADLKHELEIWDQINQMKRMGVPKSRIDSYMASVGFADVETGDSTEYGRQSQIDTVSKLLPHVSDPEDKKMLIYSLMGSAGKGGENNMLVMQMLMNNANKSDSMEKEFMKEWMKDMRDKTKESDIEKFGSMMKAMGEMNKNMFGGDNSVDKFLQTISKGKELGLVQEPADTTLEGRKYDLEEKRIDLEYDKIERQEEAEKEGKKAQMEVLNDGIATLGKFASALLDKGSGDDDDSKETTHHDPKNIPQMSEPFDCAGCGKELQFDVAKDRLIKCPFGCGYEYGVKGHDVFQTQESEKKFGNNEKAEE